MRCLLLLIAIAACGKSASMHVDSSSPPPDADYMDAAGMFGDPCSQQVNQVTPCRAQHMDGWCVVKDVGGPPTCQQSCDTQACPSGETPIPIVGGHCYCR